MSDRFIYVTYIRTTPEKLWEALTNPQFIRQYWFGMTQESDWKPGASWQMKFADGSVADAGEIGETDPPRRLVIRWRNEWKPELKAEGFSRATYALEPIGDTMKLTVTHEIDRTGSSFIEAVAGGWPKVLASLKSYLETGTALKEMPKSS